MMDSRGNFEKIGKKATLKDVAKLCGVSTMTVSRILNNKETVARETADKIRKAMRQLNYTPNLLAKSLKSNRTRTFGMVMSDSNDLIFAKMTKGVVDASASADYNVIIATANNSRALESSSVSMLLDKRIDGLVMGAPFSLGKKEIARIHGSGVPVVIVMRASKHPVDFVTSDNVAGGYEIVRHLVEDRGVTELNFINLYRQNSSGIERADGNRDAMLALGLDYDAAHVLSSRPSIEDGYMAMRELMNRGVRRGGIVCGCDFIALGAVQAALEAGIRVPEEMKFCGFDDIGLLDLLKVPLTTMRQQVYEMGQEAVRLLLRRQGNPNAGMEPEQLRLPCELVVRQST